MAATTRQVKKGKVLSKPTDSENEIKRFKWDTEIVGHLLQSLLDYKCQMEYRNSDFNADKSKQYEAVRTSLAERYHDTEVSFFGPKDLDTVDEDDRENCIKKIEVQKRQIRKGYGRVMEKVKELRQGFSSAVTAGTRSGSGKLVMEFYDLIVQIGGGHLPLLSLFHLESSLRKQIPVCWTKILLSMREKILVYHGQ